MELKTKIWLNTRISKNGLSPLSVRVRFGDIDRSIAHPENIRVTKEWFEKYYFADYDKMKKMIDFEALIRNTFADMANPDFDTLKDIVLDKKEKDKKILSINDLFYYYAIKQTGRNAGRVTTVGDSFNEFLNMVHNRRSTNTPIGWVSQRLLGEYSAYLKDRKNLSKDTIRTYESVILSALRSAGIVVEYRRTSALKGRAIDNMHEFADMVKIMKYEPISADQRFYRDMFLAQFYLNGCNAIDLASLRYENVNDVKNTITFVRNKVKNKTGKAIEVFITPELSEIISKHGNDRSDDRAFIFPLAQNVASVDGKVDSDQINELYAKPCNAHLAQIAQSLNLRNKLTTYSARHSFINIHLNELSTPLQEVSEMVGHSNIETTKRYYKGLTRDKVSSNAMKLSLAS